MGLTVRHASASFQKAERIYVDIGDSEGELIVVRGAPQEGDTIAIRGAENRASVQYLRKSAVLSIQAHNRCEPVVGCCVSATK